MRLSVKKSDIGYCLNVYTYRVLFNGERINNCYTADEERGEIHIYKESGCEILFGDVQIVNPKREKLKKRYPTLSNDYIL